MYATMRQLVKSNYFIKLHAILTHYDTIFYDILHFDKTRGVMINKEIIIKMDTSPLYSSLKTECKQIMK